MTLPDSLSRSVPFCRGCHFLGMQGTDCYFWCINTQGFFIFNLLERSGIDVKAQAVRNSSRLTMRARSLAKKAGVRYDS